MTLTQLECFVAVARERHFRKAAEHLQRTQPAVSLQIQKLEGELRLALFSRNGVRVGLTPNGEALLPYAEEILANSRIALTQMEAIRDGVHRRIRIGALPTIAAYFLPAVLLKFTSRYPGIEITLCEQMVSQELTSTLLESQIDLAFVLGGPHAPGVKPLALFEEEFYVGVAHAHPLASQNEVSADMLRNESFITYGAPVHDTREVTFNVCRAAGFDPKIAFESEDAGTIQRFVAANLGITILPEMVFRGVGLRGIRVLRLRDNAPRRTITLRRRAEMCTSRALMQLIATAKEVSESWQSGAHASDSGLWELSPPAIPPMGQVPRNGAVSSTRAY